MLRLAQRYIRDPVHINLSPEKLTVESIRQTYITVAPEKKFDLLLKVMDRENPKQCIIFCERKRTAHNLYLEIASETGLVGLALFAAALGACYAALRRARQRYERVGDASLAAIARGLQVALTGYLVTALFLHGQFPRHLWLLLGLALAVERCSRDALNVESARAEVGA